MAENKKCTSCGKKLEDQYDTEAGWHTIQVGDDHVGICLECSKKKVYVSKDNIEKFVIKLENRISFLDAKIEAESKEKHGVDTNDLNERKLIRAITEDLETLTTFHEN